MSSLSRELVFLILQFLDEEKFKETVHKLEQESGFYFNMKHFEDLVQGGEWDEVERYLSGFTKVEDNRYSMKIFFEIRKQKYLEALDRHDRAKAVEILVKDLKVFASFNEELFKEITQLLTLDNFRQNEQLSKYGDTKSARNIMLMELKKLIEANPLFRDKLNFPPFKASRLRTLINQSLNWQHQLCKNPRPNPDIKTLFTDHSCAAPTNGARAPPPANGPIVGPIPKSAGFPPMGAHAPFQPVVSPSPNAIAGWMTNPSPSLPHPGVAQVPPGLVQPPNTAAFLKHPRTPTSAPGIDYQSADSEHLMKRMRVGQPDEVSFSGASHPPNVYSQEDLPKQVVRTLNQGSNVMSLDFHPVQQTILLVGTNVGDIGIWEVGSRERIAHKTFKVWEIGACTLPLQAALMKDAAICVNRCLWSPDGNILGVAFSKHIVQTYTFVPNGELRQQAEIDAHIGGVNDIAFSHPNKSLSIITCGDDKLIKVWDAQTRPVHASLTNSNTSDASSHRRPLFGSSPTRPSAEALSSPAHVASPFAPMDSSPAAAAAAAPTTASAPPLDDCLRLLRGERNEQKLAGLLIAANVCRAGDAAAVAEVYRAVGPRFLRRLLNTGLGKVEGGKEEEREAYLRLAVTVLAGLARVPEVAANEGVVSAVPLVAEVVSKSPDLTITEECFELLSLVAMASDDGAHKFCEPGIIDMLFGQISSFPEGSRCLELATHLMQLLVHKLRADNMSVERLQGMASMVASLAVPFNVLHTTVKFESLHMLTALLSQKESPLHGALRSMPSTIWESHIRGGIIDVLQNRVVSSEKLQALLLAECMMSILGESWLSEDHKILDNKSVMSVNKFILLVLESARVEVAVLLNELAFSKYESSESSQIDDAISQKQRNLAILFSLIERIIKMISDASSGDGEPSQIIHERTIMQAIKGLNETISLVLDFLQDAKDHGQWKGDDLLAAVRIVGSYLAETPYACQEKTGRLLEFIFSIEGQDESRPFYSVRFMLPMLSQITTTADGCSTLVSFGGHKAVIDCLVKMTEENGMMIDNGSVFLACDTIINIMSNRKSSHIQMETCFIHLLQALITWAGTTDASSVIITASSLCTMVMELTSEEFLLSCSDFDPKTLGSLSDLIVRSLHQDIADGDMEQFNQKQIIISCYKRWADRFPRVRNVVHQHVSV